MMKLLIAALFASLAFAGCLGQNGAAPTATPTVAPTQAPSGTQGTDYVEAESSIDAAVESSQNAQGSYEGSEELVLEEQDYDA